MIKIWTKFPDMATKWQIEKTTVYPLFSLFIQFSAIEIRWLSLFSRKAYDDWKKRWGTHARWWATAIFLLIELNIKANPPLSTHISETARFFSLLSNFGKKDKMQL